MLSFAPVAAFETANFVARERFYDLHLVSESGKRIANSLGGTVDTEPMEEHSYDTLLVGATSEVVPATPGTIAFLREAAASVRRIASICLGAFTLAEAGLLDGRRATTHWAAAQVLQQRFPKVRVEMDRFLQAYAIEKVRVESRKKGFTVTEHQLQDGSVRLQIVEGY